MLFTPTLRRRRSFSLRGGLRWTAIGVCAVLVYDIVAAGGAVYLIGLAAIGVIALFAWRWPAWAVVFFAAFTPLNRFVILLIFHVTGSAELAKLLLLWKEGLIAVLLARVIY